MVAAILKDFTEPVMGRLKGQQGYQLSDRSATVFAKALSELPFGNSFTFGVGVFCTVVVSCHFWWCPS